MSQGLEFEVRNRLSSAQVEDLLRLYGNEWWSAQRTRPDVERMLAASDLLLAIIEKGSGSLAAFARVLTDGTYLALVLDVIVAPEYRGLGLGRLLVERICSEAHTAERCEHRAGLPARARPFCTRSGVSRSTSDPVLADAAAQQAAAEEERRGR